MEYTHDFTEPEPLEVIEGVENPWEEPFLWKVEMYLMSKYAPEFVEASIWKVRSAALERAKIVKEHHVVIQSMSELQRLIESDLAQYAQWTPPKRYRKGTVMRQAPRPGIGRDYAQQAIE